MQKKSFTSATELADMGYCEKKILLSQRLGRRVSPNRAEARREGVAIHWTFHRDAIAVAPNVRSSEVKPWCFIASELFGQTAWETSALRMWRDRVLRQHAIGRAFIGTYYRHSPGIARWLRRHRRARALVRVLLRPLAAVLKWCLDRNVSARGVGR